MENSYAEFLAGKKVVDGPSGLSNPGPVTPMAFDFQREIILWALRRGRAAIFADCGMGKTLIQIEWARQVPGDVLILAPLAVASQTVFEGKKFAVQVNLCRTGRDVRPGINITNYEMLEHFDAGKFAGVVLDESSILKSFTGRTKRAIMKKFADTKWKLACTATPAPNDYLELGNHADFLGVMKSNEMISRFFINDSMQAGSYRLKEHARVPFWEWVSSWAVCISKPSDLGYSDHGYILPPIKNHLVKVGTADLPPMEGELFRIADMSATSIHKELRATANKRAQAVANLVNRSREKWIVWINTNYEANALMPMLDPDAVDIRGDDSREEKEARLLGFIDGKYRVMVTKSSIAGFGVNLQVCHNVAFMGLSYSYEQYYQATRRSWRFGQKNQVNVHIIVADSETRVLDVIARKEEEHIRMKKEMVSNMGNQMGNTKIEKPQESEEHGESWRLLLGDSVTRIKELESGIVDLSIFSPPFSNLYIYSDHAADMGNSKDDAEFMRHFAFLVKEMFRVTRNGRLAVIHCKDLPLYKNRDGAAGLRDFPGDIIRLFEECGWTYHSRVTIWKDPVIEMQRTKNHGLLYKQLCKDSAASRQGMADYMIVMRKWSDGEEKPVTRGGERFFDYVGMSGPAARELNSGRSKEERARLYSIDVWQRYASPVWFDVQQTKVLNIRQARESKDEKHICPLQLDVIERSVELWSNPGDLVFSPFAGIGSEGYQAVKMGRRFIGIELKESYFRCAVGNLKAAQSAMNEGTLFAEDLSHAE